MGRHELITVDEAAALANVSVKTIDRWIRRGWLPYVQAIPGSPRKVQRSAVIAMLEPKMGSQRDEDIA